MPTFLAQILTQAKAIWTRLDASQRLTIGVVIAATIVGLGAIIWYAGQPDYVVVNGGKEFREVKAALDKADISYHTNGREVSVPREREVAARRAMAEEGIGEDGSSAGLTSALGKTAKEAEDVLWRNPVWLTLSDMVTKTLESITLMDLMCDESEVQKELNNQLGLSSTTSQKLFRISETHNETA